MNISIRAVRVIVLVIYCLIWTGLQAAFIISACVLAGPLAIVLNGLSFIMRGYFITEIEMLKVEHLLEGSFHYMEWVVPDMILGARV
ncbi:MAG: hypothetical protein RL662_152 [Bacteroidota bacterium]|jgi:hypothetical protein